jgi:hypothetical protein
MTIACSVYGAALPSLLRVSSKHADRAAGDRSARSGSVVLSWERGRGKRGWEWGWWDPVLVPGAYLLPPRDTGLIRA